MPISEDQRQTLSAIKDGWPVINSRFHTPNLQPLLDLGLITERTEYDLTEAGRSALKEQS